MRTNDESVQSLEIEATASDEFKDNLNTLYQRRVAEALSLLKTAREERTEIVKRHNEVLNQRHNL